MVSGQLCAVRNGFPHKTRVYTVVPGFSPNHNMGVFNNSVDTAERALVERYFLCKGKDGFRPALPVSNSRYHRVSYQKFRKLVLEHMPHLPVMTEDETILRFPPQKRAVYESARNSYATQGPISKNDALLDGFTKFEKQDISKAPRMINPRKARYNLQVGRYLKHYEHHCFTAINEAFGGRTRATVIKGFDADDSAEILFSKWKRFANPVAVGLDATKFDMHVSIAALRYEHSFYNLYWRSKLLAKYLKWQLVNKGTARMDDGFVRYLMFGTRSSGDVNTSLGNCILMCAMIWCYAEEKGIDIELANNGDDCVVFMELSDLERFQGIEGWMWKNGFEVVLEEPYRNFEDIEFCQTHPIKLSTGWRMVRNVSTCFIKDVMCLRPMPNEKSYKRWLYAVGRAGMSLNKGVPVLEEFYQMFVRSGLKSDKYQALVSVYRFAGTSKRSAVVTDEVRANFFLSTGINPDEQLALESALRAQSIGTPVHESIDRRDLNVELPGSQLFTSLIHNE